MTTRYVLKCGKCGWQQSYTRNPDWEHWRDCKECYTRNSVSKRKEEGG